MGCADGMAAGLLTGGGAGNFDSALMSAYSIDAAGARGIMVFVA